MLGVASKSYRTDIQGLRGIAIALVVLLHAGITGFEGGFVGVELFFVLSGYVVTESMLRAPREAFGSNLISFYKKRVMRIVPTATLVVLVTLFAAYFLLGPAFNDDILKDAIWSSYFAENFRLIETGANYFIAGLDKSLLNHFWYLAIEQQYYLVFPVLFFALYKLTNRGVLAAFLIASIAASAWCSVYLTNADATSAYYSPYTRVWELSLGALIALVPARIAMASPKALNTVLALVGLAMIAYSAVTFTSRNPYPGTLAWVPALGTALLLWANENSHRFASVSWLSWRPLRYLGDISYPLYLWHFVWLTLPSQLPEPLVGWWWLPLELLCATVCAILSHHLIEERLRASTRFADPISVLVFLLITLVAIWDATVLIGYLQATS